MSGTLEMFFDGKLFGNRKKRWQNRHAMEWPEEWRHYTSFVTVRNPYTRFFSYYNFYCKDKDKDILEFARSREWKSTSVVRLLDSFRIDHVVRLEHWEGDFRKLPFASQESYRLFHWTRSKKKAMDYGREVKQIVRTQYKEDFARFGYDPKDLLSCFDVRFL